MAAAMEETTMAVTTPRECLIRELQTYLGVVEECIRRNAEVQACLRVSSEFQVQEVVDGIRARARAFQAHGAQCRREVHAAQDHIVKALDAERGAFENSCAVATALSLAGAKGLELRAALLVLPPSETINGAPTLVWAACRDPRPLLTADCPGELPTYKPSPLHSVLAKQPPVLPSLVPFACCEPGDFNVYSDVDTEYPFDSRFHVYVTVEWSSPMAVALASAAGCAFVLTRAPLRDAGWYAGALPNVADEVRFVWSPPTPGHDDTVVGTACVTLDSKTDMSITPVIEFEIQGWFRGVQLLHRPLRVAAVCVPPPTQPTNLTRDSRHYVMRADGAFAVADPTKPDAFVCPWVQGLKQFRSRTDGFFELGSEPVCPSGTDISWVPMAGRQRFCLPDGTLYWADEHFEPLPPTPPHLGSRGVWKQPPMVHASGGQLCPAPPGFHTSHAACLSAGHPIVASSNGITPVCIATAHPYRQEVIVHEYHTNKPVGSFHTGGAVVTSLAFSGMCLWAALDDGTLLGVPLPPRNGQRPAPPVLHNLSVGDAYLCPGPFGSVLFFVGPAPGGGTLVCCSMEGVHRTFLPFDQPGRFWLGGGPGFSWENASVVVLTKLVVVTTTTSLLRLRKEM